MHPITEPHQSGLLAVSPRHQIYWEVSGNPHGKPVVFLHGGPGAGTIPAQRGFFNPERYRIVLMDQRGCGRSLPYACVEENTTWDLVADIEQVRQMLGIERWMVFGGSWGSTLALAYAQSHPARVSELVLRGVFLCRPSEWRWLNQSGGASQIFPDAWQQYYLQPFHGQEPSNLIAAYHTLLLHPDTPESARLQAARCWTQWEAHTCYLEHNQAAIDEYANEHAALACARISCHYASHAGWLEGERALLANTDKIRRIPTVMVQGRYDICTPPQSAWELKQALPAADLQFVLASHSAFEPEIAKALVAATDYFADNDGQPNKTA